MIKSVRVVLVGLGNVNQGLLKILHEKEKEIAEKYKLHFKIVAVADSTGLAVRTRGFDYEVLINHKHNKKKVNELREFIPKPTIDVVNCAKADLLIEASPVNLTDGSPGLQVTRAALKAGWKVVLANKGPLVLAFDELQALAKAHKSKIGYSATVCGGLPVINVLQRDLKTASLTNIWGIFNATSNFVLEEMEKGNKMEDAIREAQRIGAAETDPSLDLSGQDTANKLFILMKSFTDFAGSVSDIKLRGIEEVSAQQIKEAAEKNLKIKLVASAHRKEGTWNLSVTPIEVAGDSFLGSCNGWEMGIEVKTDLYESISMKNYEADPTGTSAAVLRDAIDLFG
ncbi:MAG: hypothetical protein RIB47_05665 [Cyclobacteriaceae bacterium]